MANIMSSFKLQNHPSRNGFDLSNRHTFSAKLGELLPVQVKECLPGDKFKINLSHFSRTQPLNGPAYVRIREYYDFCFVPYRLLWKYFDQFINQMPNNVAASSVDSESHNFTRHPYFSYKDISFYFDALDQNSVVDELGLTKSSTSQKLLEHLGYGDIPSWSNYDNVMAKDFACNPFPLLAYQKIYNDIFRYDQWERPLPHCFNVDYMDDPNDMMIPVGSELGYSGVDMFNLRYANYPKDLIMGILPNSQYGDVSIVSTTTGLDSLRTPVTSGQSWNFSIHANAGNNSPTQGLGVPLTDKASIDSFFNFSILALRKAEFLQKWKEVAQTAKQDYRDQIKAHWGVEISKARSGVVEYLGGITSNVQIEGEVNSNLADGSTIIKGTAISGSHGQIDFDVPEHGIIMCIYHAAPLLDYPASNNFDWFNIKTNVADYAIPEMDKTGMQILPTAIVDSRKASYETFGDFTGYVPRYIDYKTDIDKVYGIFNKAEDYKAWVAPFDFNKWQDIAHVANSWVYKAFKVNSSFFDNVFAVNVNSDVTTDQLLCNADFDVKVVRNLDTNGMPY